jgi:acyl-CoA synthetase (AMP-forming)/AMP-acid ligase II
MVAAPRAAPNSPASDERGGIEAMPFVSLKDLLHDSARRFGDAIAIADDAIAISYRELESLAELLATELRKRGVGRSDAVAIASDSSVELALALFAVTTSGAAAVLVDPALTTSERAARCRSARAKALLVPDRLRDRFEDDASPIWTLSLERTSAGLRPAVHSSAARTDEVASAGDATLLLFTTGTTSTPKIVPLTASNLSASVDGICATYALSPSDATLLVMPMFHGHGLIAGVLATLASGGSVRLPRARRFSASTFWQEMIDAHATWYTAVPTIHQVLLARAAREYPRDDAPKLRFIRSCSAPLADKVLVDLETTFGAPVLQAYGMTETAHQATSNPLPVKGPHKVGSVGLGSGVEVRIASGEVCVRGAAVTSGYLNAPAANAASFVDGWFRTGDLGELDADGYLFLKGRLKEIINRGGEKISPSAIDDALLSNPKVEDALTFGVPDAKYGEEVAAAIVLKPGQSATAQELTQYSLDRLSAFEIPKRFYFVSDLPRTAKGSGDRQKLAAMFGGR